MKRSLFLPVFIFSRIAMISDRLIKHAAIARSRGLLFCAHPPKAMLPSPKLARINGTCQQKAKSVAETIAPILLMNLYI